MGTRPHRRFTAFQKIVDDVIALKVDFVLISEDIATVISKALPLPIFIKLERLTARIPFIYFMVTMIIKLSKMQANCQQTFMFLAIA